MKTKFSGILTLLLAFVVQLTFAQEKTISGTVSDPSGLPLPGATVLVKGTTSGTSTDFDGRYSIKAKQGATLVFSFVGYSTKEIAVGTSNSINVTMAEDAAALEEVVVVAYGTQTRESIVGAIDVIKAETISNQQVTSPLRALQGTVAGVNLITAGGQPGTNPEFVIRGFGSFNGNNSPLIVVDGAPFNGNINTISQDQIESISVLKDAGSASLYGSRAANGVVIITTKRGKRNSGAEISLRTQYGLSNPSVGIHDLVNPEEYMKLMWTSLRNDNLYGLGQSPVDAALNASNGLVPFIGYNPFGVNNPIDTDGNLVSGANLLWDTDWEESVLRRNVPRINHTLSVSGGGEKSNYFFSFDYLNEDGPVIKSDFERIATRAAIDTEVNDWLKTGITLGYSRSNSNNPDQTSGSTTQAISWIYNNSSVYPIYVRDANGNVIRDANGGLIYDLGNGNGRPVGQPVNNIRPGIVGENILASILLGTEKRIRTNLVGSTYAEVNFLNDFTFRTTFNYENFVFDSHSFDDDEIGAASSVQGRVSKTRNITSTLNAIQALNYSKSFGKHSVSFDAIYEANTNATDTFSASSTGFLPGQQELGNGTVAESFGGFRQEQRITSYLGRLSYNFDRKYFIEGSYREDKSSQFEEQFRTGDFFSVGGSWVVSNESFLKNVSWINNLKLRASIGELGNINIPGGFFPTSFLFGGANFNNVTISPVEGQGSNLPAGTLPDPALKWETARTSNYGLDFTIFNGALSGSVEYFNRESVDLIQDITATPSPGVPVVRANAGIINNSGWEVTLNSNIIDQENVTWSLGGNFALLKNEIKQISPFSDRQIQGTKLWEPGNSLFEFYLREWAGVDPATGDALWYIDVTDTNGDVIGRDVTNQYDIATRYETGKESLPDIQGGLNTTFRYKQFDIYALFNFSSGAYLLDTDYSGLINPAVGGSAHPDNFKAWSQPGDITNIPRLTQAQNNFASQSTRYLFKNDYLRLKALTIGYNLPQKDLDRLGLKQFRLYIQGDNLVTWQSHKGIDPEQAFNGLTNNRSPLQRTLTFGALIKL
ncbi:SusC/RagA family TonB-linked outer membrane protein [Siansivirga zeaxanthinifaciens]|uniref:Carbohydrate-binding protein SusC n=1 Tax=Siansivirga zeaxanthinifaciens CC-SAMT-1 TaxID=1454006 RepID=A0A0C5W5Q0_9FLAO|nr:TonB-dependent receptor [Siansivirga zeaxanthinifaciens]AJR02473.1 carbohydrate-binding protein SusC [Siansivirga zeaxanthinifaciens CC-SAMT-1]